jgi:hypothetical protein
LIDRPASEQIGYLIDADPAGLDWLLPAAGKD